MQTITLLPSGSICARNTLATAFANSTNYFFLNIIHSSANFVDWYAHMHTGYIILIFDCIGKCAIFWY